MVEVEVVTPASRQPDRLRRLRTLRWWFGVALVGVPALTAVNGWAPEGTEFEKAWGVALVAWLLLYAHVGDLGDADLDPRAESTLNLGETTLNLGQLRDLRKLRRWYGVALIAIAVLAGVFGVESAGIVTDIVLAAALVGWLVVVAVVREVQRDTRGEQQREPVDPLDDGGVFEDESVFEESAIRDDAPWLVDPYQVLDVPCRATPEQIRSAFRKLSLIHHPDRRGDSARFRQIRAAYEILSDPERRRELDSWRAVSDALR